VGVVAMVPYLVLQLKGLGIIVSISSDGRISSHWAIVIGTVALTLYVTISGIHGSAWTSVLKDAVILALGVNAATMARDYAQHQLAEATAWEKVSRSADFGEPYPAELPAGGAAA
ncbi:hypothetical protein ACWEWX_50840, partial [Streptomyces asiaticus]